ncbi:MAG: SpoIID/LytB domain-containing protein [Myxococcota bacterium]
MLHSTQLRFTVDGEPVVTVGVMDRQESVTVTADAGLRVRFSGGVGGEVVLPAGHRLVARVDDGEAGETRYRVVLEGHRGGDLEAIQAARKRWKEREIPHEIIEIGGVVGYPGRLLDNRKTLLVAEEVHESRDAAEAAARALAERWTFEEEPGVYSDPVHRAEGVIVATDPETGFTLRQRDMLDVSAADGGPVEVKRVEYGRGYSHHGYEDRRFHGRILVALDPTARLAVVNRVSAEKLLQGLVPSETFPSAPEAALDAQAITARGELLAKLGVRHLADPYLVCARQHCQVYSGLAKEKPRTNAAVERTRGLMMFDDDDELVDSVYSASCGGHTEHNEHVWEGPPRAPLRGRADAADRDGIPWEEGESPDDGQLRTFLEDPPDSWCADTSLGGDVHRWTRTLPDDELDRMVNARHEVGHVTGIEVLERGVSGRVERVRFAGEDDEVVVGRELAVRRLLDNLRSGMFVVDHADGEWTFTGGGYGHGVGMCQYGAIGQAEDGRSAREILRHYYRGAKVEKVY